MALQVKKLRPDLVFTPMQTMGSWGRDYKLLLTLHDLIYYEHRTPPRDLPAPVRLLWRLYHLAWWPQRMLLNRGDGVVTVSETTAGLIHEHHLTDRPVTVIPNAADDLVRAHAAPSAGPRGIVSCTWARTCPTRTSTRSCVRSRPCPTTNCTC